MKIDTTGKPLASALTRPAGEKTSAAGRKTEAARQESVSINPLAVQMQAMEANNAEPAFNADKVAEIRQAIADGKFSIRTDAIADKLMASVKELLG